MCNTDMSSSANLSQEVPCKVYKRRWIVLLLYCLYAISSLLQWAMYSVIAGVVSDYYEILYPVSQWTSLIGIITYLIFSIPSLFVLDKWGLRWSCIIGIIGTCVGSWLKVASVNPSRYWVLVLGQGIVGIFRVLILPLPQKIASVWFGSNEVSRACGLAVLGPKFSAILGFLLPPLIVDGKTKEEVETQLYILAYIVAIFPTILLPLIVFCKVLEAIKKNAPHLSKVFSDAPPTPPSRAQLNIQNRSTFKFSDYVKSIKKLLTNKSFMVFLIIFGITSGMESPLYIILNQIVLKYHEGAEKDVGYIGVTITVFGLFGSYGFGYLMDISPRYKLITITVFILNALALIVFLSTISFSLYLVYITAAITGFFIMGILTIGFIIAAELTYPEPEDTTGGFLMTVSQICGLCFTYVYTYLFMYASELISIVVIGSILLLTTLLFVFVKFDLRKQNIEKQKK